jgi:DNA-binding transcriptional ArsR family regulator
MQAPPESAMRRLSDEQVSLVARRSRALGDATRVRIVGVLGRSEHHVGQIAIALGLPPSSVSKHLQVLFQADLVHRRREASTVIYSVAHDGLLDWCRYLGAPRWATPPPRG